MDPSLRRPRLRQVVYVYDENDGGSEYASCGGKSLPVDGEPTSLPDVNVDTSGACVVCCCHNKTEVSPTNPRIGFPGPIALFGFGTTVLLSNLAEAGIVDHNALMDCMAIFMGGLVQFVCGFFELINKNTVGCIICTGYGAFNMILGMSNVLHASTAPITHNFSGGFFFVWGFFALTVFLMGCKGPLVGTLMNTTVVINFYLTAIGNWSDNDTIRHIAGYDGIVVGSLAIYMAMAVSLYAAHGKDILPIIHHDNFKNFRW